MDYDLEKILNGGQHDKLVCDKLMYTLHQLQCYVSGWALARHWEEHENR